MGLSKSGFDKVISNKALILLGICPNIILFVLSACDNRVARQEPFLKKKTVTLNHPNFSLL